MIKTNNHFSSQGESAGGAAELGGHYEADGGAAGDAALLLRPLLRPVLLRGQHGEHENTCKTMGKA